MASKLKTATLSAAYRAGLLNPFRHRLPPAIWRHLAFDGVFTETLGEGRAFRIRHGGVQVENAIYWHGWGNAFEAWSGRLWAQLATNARCIVDIGANTGVYALVAQAVAPADARILAVEPVERVFRRLAGNVALNGDRVELAQLALSDHAGEVVLYDTDDEHVYSASLEPRMLGERATKTTTVPVERLDDLLAQRGWPVADLLKIDVELHEPAVFRGMPKVLASRPPMLVEILAPDVGDELLKLTEGLGYDLFEIDEACGPRPCTTPGWRHGAPGHLNHLFLHPSTLLSREGWPS